MCALSSILWVKPADLVSDQVAGEIVSFNDFRCRYNRVKVLVWTNLISAVVVCGLTAVRTKGSLWCAPHPMGCPSTCMPQRLRPCGARVRAGAAPRAARDQSPAASQQASGSADVPHALLSELDETLLHCRRPRLCCSIWFNASMESGRLHWTFLLCSPCCKMLLTQADVRTVDGALQHFRLL